MVDIVDIVIEVEAGNSSACFDLRVEFETGSLEGLEAVSIGKGLDEVEKTQRLGIAKPLESKEGVTRWELVAFDLRE